MKSLRLSIVAMSVGAIVGCGGEDSSGSDTKTKATVYQAEVADEHLQDALVWLDINNNYQLDAGEPNSYTDSTGKALLEVTANYTVPQAHSLIASAIKDRTINKTTGEKVSKSYMMVAPAGVQRISPVSHLIYSKQKAEGYDFAQATTTVADIIDEVSEQDLVQFLNKQDNKKLQALSHSLSSMMPESETPLTHLQLVQSHPDLETAVAAFNDRSIKKLKAEFGHVSDENPIPVVVGQTVTTDVRRASDNKQSVETGLSVPNNQGSTPTTTTETSHPNQTEESVPVKVIIPTLEVTTRTDTQGTAQVPESNPLAPEQLLSPDQGSGEGSPSDGVPETGITGNSQPNETAPALEPEKSGTVIEATTQNLPFNNAEAQPVQTPIVADIGTLLTRISDELVTAEEDSAFDQSKSLDVLASELIYGLQADGRWLDIEYDGTTSYRLSAEHHLERLQTIAAAFRKTNNQEYELLANKALNFWLITKPIMAGWWSEYGEFHALAQVAFLLGDGLREDLRLEVIQLLPTSVNTSEVGLPVLDHAMNIIYRGLLLNDALLVGNGLKAIERAIEALVVEGTEADWSTVLNKQFDSGKSTIEYFNVALSWAYSVKDLTWKFSDIAINNLTSMLLNGIRWFDRVNQLNESFSYNDESISKSTIPTLATLNKVVDLNPTRLKEVQDYRSHLYYDRPSGESRFLHFWEDDYTETATDGYLFRVGMKSDRTVSILSHEEQYQPGFWARLGSAFLTLSGDEYRDILPLFDWTKVPGVTAPKYVPTGYSLSDALQNSSFVGGTGNGRFGISTMVMEVVIPREFVAMEEFYQPNGQVIVGGKYVGGTTKAKKSWFSFGKQVVALGAGISSTHDDVPVTTTLNQTLLDGEVTLGNQYGYAYLNHSGEPYHNINLSNWIHHDGVGYVFLDQLPRMVLMNQQSGRWSDIQPLASQNIIEKGVFTLFTYHGVKPTNSYYQYVILPNSTVHEVHEYRRNLPVLILQNSSSIQAVADVEKDIVGAVFFEPGELDVGLYHPNYSNYRVKVDRPSVVVLDNSSGLMEVAISTPGQAYSVVDLTVVRDGYSPITQQVVTPGKKELVGRSVNFVLSEGQDHNSITDSLAIEALNNKNYSQ